MEYHLVFDASLLYFWIDLLFYFSLVYFYFSSLPSLATDLLATFGAVLLSLFFSPSLMTYILVVSSSMSAQQFLIFHWLKVLTNSCTVFRCSMTLFIRSPLKVSTYCEVSCLFILRDSSFLALSSKLFGIYLFTSTQFSIWFFIHRIYITQCIHWPSSIPARI